MVATFKLGAGAGMGEKGISIDHSFILCLTNDEDDDPLDSSSVWV